MAKELTVEEQELYHYIVEYASVKGITLEGFEAVVAMVKKIYKQQTLA